MPSLLEDIFRDCQGEFMGKTGLEIGGPSEVYLRGGLFPVYSVAAAFRRRSEWNLENRCLHHHVFDTRLAILTVDHAGFRIRAIGGALPYHIFVVAQKVSEGVRPDNAGFLHPRARCLVSSPFAMDRSA